MRTQSCACIIAIAGLLGCAAAAPTSTSTVIVEEASLSAGGEWFAGQYRLTLNTATFAAELDFLPSRNGMTTPPQALAYDLDIDQFLQPDSLLLGAIETDADGDIVLTFQHRHPFPTPLLANPASGLNRADLGYTGRLVAVTTGNPHFFFGDSVRLNPGLLKDPDGFVGTGTLLADRGRGVVLTNTYPYKLLVDEAEDNRSGRSNGGDPAGNYDIANGGWQRDNIGSGNNWVGFDYLHGGQLSTIDVALLRSGIGSGPYFTLDLAVLIKYTDPRGSTQVGSRLPDADGDPLAFAYRLPYAALDCSHIALDSAAPELDDAPAGDTAEISVRLRDWDVLASEASGPVLGSETDVSLVPFGTSGEPVGTIDAPAIAGTLIDVVGGSGASGHPGDELTYTATLTNELGSAAPGLYYALIRFVDPQDSDPNRDFYSSGVDPEFLTPAPDRRLASRTYQVLPITIHEGN